MIKQQFFAGFDDFFGFAHAPHAVVATGKQSARGADKACSAPFERPQIFLRGRVVPHARIHRRGKQERRARRKRRGRQHIVRDAVRDFRHDVGRRRSNQKQIRALGERHMFHFPRDRRGERIGHHRIFGKRLKS